MNNVSPVVIKISGHNLADHDYLTELALTLREFPQPAVIVHGGAKEITEMQDIRGIVPNYVDGLRITDADSMYIVEMILSGIVNKRFVRYLVNAGVEAIGLSGVDRGLMRAVKHPHPTQDMDHTGTIISVREEVLLDLLVQGVTPVVSPVCLGDDAPHSYNVNADHVCGAIAAAINADRVYFISNVGGLLIDDDVIPQIDPEQIENLIEHGTIFGGMIPKVRTAVEVLDRGVPEAIITDLAGLKAGTGTVFSNIVKKQPIT